MGADGRGECENWKIGKCENEGTLEAGAMNVKIGKCGNVEMTELRRLNHPCTQMLILAHSPPWRGARRAGWVMNDEKMTETGMMENETGKR
jgi:hypothetical protein